jgi:hypothetical protein
LEGDGLINVGEDPTDGRRRIASLTGSGRVEWLELDRRSDVAAGRVLESLSPDQRRRLSDALVTAQGLLCLSTITREVVEPDRPGATAAMRSHFAELDERFVDGFDPGVGWATVLDERRAPGGAFVTVVDDGEVVDRGRMGPRRGVPRHQFDVARPIAMYLGAGYDSIEPYNDNPDAERWFRKSLE